MEEKSNTSLVMFIFSIRSICFRFFFSYSSEMRQLAASTRWYKSELDDYKAAQTQPMSFMHTSWPGTNELAISR